MKKVVKLKAKKSDKFYITSAIPYVNANPHIGHALEFVQTDAIRRWHALLGGKTFLTTGSDENSLKNVQAAEERGITAAQLCAENAEKFRQLCDFLGLRYDSFLRSSVPEKHWPGVHKLWELCSKDIYKKNYRGLYCIGCEAFYTESELREGRCPEHNSVPQVVEEENFFFRLSKYQEQLEKLIETDKLKIYPESRKNEVLSFIKQGLEDFSVSRSSARAKGWGVPVPGSDQIMYVWFDALNIYQTAIGFGLDEKLYKKWWPCDLHVIGKGILRFHAVYWPAILLSAGLELPKAIFVHGYVTVDGQKMSKTIGNVVDPTPLIKEYGADRLRYYMLREIPPFDDGDFSERGFVERANTELVENFSNLFYRVTSFIEKNFGGKLPAGKLGKEEEATQRYFVKKAEDVKKSMEGLRLNEALSHIMELSAELNRYFQSKKPWDGPARAGATLYTAANLLKDICILLYPFIPFTSEKALSVLNCKLDYKNIGKFALKKGHAVKSEMLFKKVEFKEDKKEAKEHEFFVDKEVSDLGVNVCFVEIHNVKVKKKHEGIEKIKKLIEDKIKKDIKNNGIIKGYREIYKKIGFEDLPSSVENLIALIKEKGKLPTINTIVDSYNAVSVDKNLVICAHDMDKINGNVRFAKFKGNEIWVPLGSVETQEIRKNEYGCVDDKQVLSRLDFKQSERTKVDNKTQNVLITFQGNKNTSNNYLRNAAEETCKYITKFCGGEYKILEIKSSNEYVETINVVDGMIPLKEFQKLDLRIGTITDVKDHPDADKLFVLQVDLGDEKRQLVAGMKGIHAAAELKGRQVIVVCNLEPKDMRGVKSEGMLLAADDATLLSPVRKVENGMKVR